MIKNLIKHSFRSFKRQKGYLAINVFGLAIGIACSLLISIYVVNELSFDRFNIKKDRIYKLILNGKIGGQEVMVTSTAAPIGPTMKKDFPEIENYCRINQFGSLILKYDNQSFTENSFIEADSSFFNIFSIPLIYGNKNTVLSEPNKLVISQSTATKIFGDENPVDKTLTIGEDSTIYTVSGVMEDVPRTCHFNANVIRSFMTNPRSSQGIWLNNSFDTYVLLYPNTLAGSVEAKIPAMIEQYVGPELRQYFGVSISEFLEQGNKYNISLQPLLKVHLDPSIDQGMKPATDPKYLIIFASVAFLIILIAAINFMNLSTAQASRRAREVGIKKVGGSSKGMLVKQFLLESLLISFIALIFAVVIVKLALPYFSELLNSELSFSILSNWYTIPLLIGFTFIVGFIAGSYPAFYLSSISPFAIMRSGKKGGSGNTKMRSVLVVFQFTASIILIIGTMIMYRQITFMLNKDLGFDKEQLLVISRAGALDNRVEAFKDRVKEIPGVINIAASTAIPGRNNNQNGYMMEGNLEESLLMQTSWVDFDFLDTYRMEIAEGRFFDESFPSDIDACIINESTVKEYQIEDPLSTRILSPTGDNDGAMDPLSVIGVIRNFNFESLNREIDPYILRFRTENMQFGYITARLAPQNMEHTVGEIEKIWQEFTSNDPLPYFYFDEDFARYLEQEKNSAQLTIIFAIFAILVASLGLLGLTSFILQQKTKEIGVRKAMGASVPNIFTLISKNILILVTVSAVIAIPVIYIIANKWLQSYHFRIDLGFVEFLLGYLIAISIALATISFRTIKAANVRPAVSLKYE